MTPTQRSLKLLREQGYLVAVVERWNPYVKIRQDLWGWMDLIAVKDNETVGIQTTSNANVSARINKIKLLPAAKFWAQSATRRIIVHGWAKKGARGQRKTFQVREIELTAEDFECQ